MAPRLLAIALAALLAFPAWAPAAAGPLCMEQVPTITGTPGDDELEGTPEADVIAGLTGNDTIVGLGGNDFLCGDAGEDVIRAGGGIDLVDTGIGADRAYAGGGPINLLIDAWPVGGIITPLPLDTSDDVLVGGPGLDWFMPDGGNDSIEGRGGSDVYDALMIFSPMHINLALGISTSPRGGLDMISGVENVLGGFYADVIVGDDDANALIGVFGTDRVLAQGGGDLVGASISGSQLDGGSDQARDTVIQILAEPGRIDLETGTVTSLEHEGDPADTLTGFDSAVGTSYDDELIGDAFFNTLIGAEGNDLLEGRGDDDRLFGDGGLGFRTHPDWAGGDRLEGEGGEDRLDGGPHTDACDGEVETACERRQVKVDRPEECPGGCARTPSGLHQAALRALLDQHGISIPQGWWSLVLTLEKRVASGA